MEAIGPSRSCHPPPHADGLSGRPVIGHHKERAVSKRPFLFSPLVASGHLPVSSIMGSIVFAYRAADAGNVPESSPRFSTVNISKWRVSSEWRFSNRPEGETPKVQRYRVERQYYELRETIHDRPGILFAFAKQTAAFMDAKGLNHLHSRHLQ